MRVPVDPIYVITTGFDVPDPNALFKRHSGIDMAVPYARPIYAPASGDLHNILSPTGGNMVQIFDGQMYHRLMHNSSFSRSDGHVNEGEEVARAGTTGLSTGVHCHWDVSPTKNPTSFNFVNPLEYIKEAEMPMNQGDVINIFPVLTGHEATEADIAAWNGKDFKDFFYNKIIPELQDHGLVNQGDLVNFFPTFTGHLPTIDDVEAWDWKLWKDFSYNKLLPEAKNRIKE